MFDKLKKDNFLEEGEKQNSAAFDVQGLSLYHLMPNNNIIIENTQNLTFSYTILESYMWKR